MPFPAPGGGYRVTLSIAAAALFAAACDHSRPFAPPATGTDQPFAAGDPVRLTFVGGARDAAWLDAGRIIYSAPDPEHAEGDRCLFLLPAGGGTITRSTCDRNPFQGDSVNTDDWPAPGPDARMIFYRAATLPGQPTQIAEDIWVGDTLGNVDHVAFTLPSCAATRPCYTGIGGVRWLDNSTVAYLMLARTPNPLCEGLKADDPTCPSDPEHGQVIALAAVADTNRFTELAGTAFASSVSARAADPTSVYFTLAGDSRVYRTTPAGTAPEIIHDFVPLGIARDVDVGNTRLVAIVGGLTRVFNTPDGTLQADQGGVLHVVNLATGTDQSPITPGYLFRRPRLSPDGGSVVAEGIPIRVDTTRDPLTRIILSIDTTVTGPADLWRFGLP